MLVFEKVRDYIDRNGIKQRTVAQKANLSVSTFNAMMNGKRTMYADDLKAICYALRVSPEIFIELHSPQSCKSPEDRTA